MGSSRNRAPGGNGHGANGTANGGGAPHANGSTLAGIGAGEAQLVVLPVVEKASDHPCFECARCCTYVAIEIDVPTTPREYDYIEWYLHHEGIGIFVDWDDKWFVKFETRCKNLTAQGLCGIYERRPDICRDFDWRECEMHVTDEPADKLLFDTADQFLDWLRTRRPRGYARFQEWKRTRARGKHDRALRRLRVTEVLPDPDPAASARRRSGASPLPR